ncbi:MAG: RNA-binding protein S1, partial [Clostridia bacterium]|nr:RNA-binding protein S1 [Clostridia bacterium]
KVNDVVKMKVLNIGEDGKISLSIKRALPPEKKEGFQKQREFKAPPKPDGSYTWTPRKEEPASFEEMMNRFKQSSDEKFSDLKRKNPEVRRARRGNSK